MAIKEAFIQALSGEGVSNERIAQIRARLGIAVETKTSVAEASAASAMRRTAT